MKNCNSLKMCITFAGCFLGAGYVSGQELWQFFGKFGKLGIAGLFAADVLFALFGIILLRLVQITEISEMDKVIIRKDIRPLRLIFLFLEIFFLFGIFVVMSAGVGALLNDVFSVPKYLGCLIFCICVFAISIIGIKGMVTAFSVIVPCLVITVMLIFAFLFEKNGVPVLLNTSNADGNPLLSNWLISAIVYVSYNIFASVGILSPFGKIIKSKKDVYVGIILGSILLLIIALTIFFSISYYTESTKDELPMLYISKQFNTFVYYVFSVLLFGGMLGTSISSVFAIDEFTKIRFNVNKKSRIIIILAVSLSAFLLSLIGFGKLISIVYPVCGYLGFIAIILIISNFIITKKSSSCK